MCRAGIYGVYVLACRYALVPKTKDMISFWWCNNCGILIQSWFKFGIKLNVLYYTRMQITKSTSLTGLQQGLRIRFITCVYIGMWR